MRHVERLLACAAVLLVSGCNVLIPAHKNSLADEKEEVYLILREHERPKDLAAAAVADLAPAAVGAVIDFVQNQLEKDAKRYTATWGTAASSEFFSKAPGDGDPYVLLDGFELVRRSEGEEVARFCFDVTPSSTGDAFQVSLESFTFKKSRAKVFDVRWWTRFPLLYGFAVPLFSDAGDEAVDLEVLVEVEATWTDAGQSTHTEQVARIAWTIPDVSIDGDGTQWAPVVVAQRQFVTDTKAPPAEPGAREEAAEARSVARTFPASSPYVSRWIPAIPVSYRGNKPWGCGTYTLRVSVTESDDFGEYVKQASDELGKRRGEIVDAVVRMIPAPAASSPRTPGQDDDEEGVGFDGSGAEEGR